MTNAHLHLSCFLAPAGMINHALHPSLSSSAASAPRTRLATVGAGSAILNTSTFQGLLRALEIGRVADSQLARPSYSRVPASTLQFIH
jgi:hypothetical protein